MKCLIINNNFLGMVRQWQQMFFENRLSGVDLVGNPDFVKLAQAYGVKAWRIRRPSDVDRVLAEAQAYDEGPCVVVAEVVKEDNVFPMIPAGAPLSGMIVEKPREQMAKPTKWCMMGFGVGLSWSGLMMETDDILALPVLEV